MTDTAYQSLRRSDVALFCAWLIALGATAGALFIGEVLGQAPCDLCWFQRAFMFPLAVVLAIAVLFGDRNAWRHALVLATIGGAIAAYHALLYAGVIPEPIRPCTADGPSCTDAAMTVAGIPIPYLSLAAFLGIAAFLILSRTGETR